MLTKNKHRVPFKNLKKKLEKKIQSKFRNKKNDEIKI
jgi:hypothetical protein